MASYNVEMQMLNSGGTYDTIYPKSFSDFYYTVTLRQGTGNSSYTVVLNNEGIIPSVIILGAYIRSTNRNSPIPGLVNYIDTGGDMVKNLVYYTNQSIITFFVSETPVLLPIFATSPPTSLGVCRANLLVEGNTISLQMKSFLDWGETNTNKPDYCMNLSSISYKIIAMK